MSEPVKSVLHEVQEARGATFRDDDGWLWTMSFGDPARPATRRSAAGSRSGTSTRWSSGTYRPGRRRPRSSGSSAATSASQAVGQVRYGAFLRRGRDARRRRHGLQARRRPLLGAHQHLRLRRLLGRADRRPRLHGREPDPRDAVDQSSRDRARATSCSRSTGDRPSAGAVTSASAPSRSSSAGVPCGCRVRGSPARSGFELFPARADAVARVERAGARRRGADRAGHHRAGPHRGRPDHLQHRLHPGRRHPVRRVARPDGRDVRRGRTSWARRRSPTRCGARRSGSRRCGSGGCGAARRRCRRGQGRRRRRHALEPGRQPARTARSGWRCWRPSTPRTAARCEVVAGAGTVPATVAPLSIKDPDKKRPRG